MKIWQIKNGIEFYKNYNVRTGLRLKFEKDVDSEVKRACKEFCAWLRKQYIFPIRVPVYIKSSYQIKASDGDMVSATFFRPYNRLHEPYARIAAGDYYEMKNERGKDSALASILCSIAHELTHYFQWINNAELTEKQEEQQASRYSKKIVYVDYASIKNHL